MTPPAKKPTTKATKAPPKKAASRAGTAKKPMPSDGDGPPPYDPAAVGRVAGRVTIETVELVGAHFERGDDGPLPTPGLSEVVPEIGIDVRWERSDGRLGCLLTFGTIFDGDDPYNLVARFRLVYGVREIDELTDEELEQFAHWNAVFNAWPYWREYLSSTINRAGLPRFVAPVMGVPRAR